MVGKIPSSIVVAVVFMSVFYLTLAVLPENAQAITHFVGGSGPGNYTTIQSAIDAASPQDTVFVYNGTYYENLVVGKSVSLVGENKNITIIDGRQVRDVVLVSANWVNISGFKVQNSSHDWFSTPAGIQLYGSQNCNIINNTLLNNYVGIMLQQSHQNTIIGNDFLLNGGGILLYQSDGNTLADNNMSDKWGGIALSSSSNSIVTSNTMVEGRFEIWGDLLEHWNTHIIDTTNTVNGRPVQYWKNAIGGTVPLDAGQVILANCSNVIVENQNMNNARVGILLGFSRDIIMANNSLSETTVGIHLLYSTNMTIVGNDIWNHYLGISPRFSSNITIRNNTLSTDRPFLLQSGGGIHPYRSTHITIADNDISGSGEAIYLQNSEYVTVSNNTLVSNKGEGVRSWICNNVTVYGNNISDNGLGIRLFDPSHFLIYHNNLTNNTIQAIDWDANKWDNDYPSGGNYWSNYTGVDDCSGPNQDVCPDPDGIGDTPYIIDADSQDRYPLMSPLGIKRPRPPSVLQAELSGGNLEDVTIAWSLSPDDGAGQNSVVGYIVYRHTTYNPNGLGYGMIASLPSGASQFVDSLAGDGNPNDYFYRVCAIDVSNETLCGENQAAKFISPLSEGRNLVSIPLILSDLSIEKDFETLAYDKSWMYDSTTAKWKSHMMSKPYYGELRSINHTMGVWINVTEESNLTVAGIVPSNTLIQLHAGWNLVGFPSFNINYTVGNLKAETGATRVEGFDQAVEPYHLRVLDDGDFLQPGYGYWVYVEADTAWIVENF